MKWSLADAARFCGTQPVGDAEVTSVVIDSRDATIGSLFVALQGERRDGHDFVLDASAAGASAVCRRGGLPAGVAGFEVDDTVEALRMLGEARRRQLDVDVVAITGSSGKTTTKDLVAAVLGPGTHAAPHSYNNELGVPLTILGCPDDAASLVVEVGSRGIGHIAHLADVVAPDVAVITNIGRAHLETFGGVEQVREAKWELVEAAGEGAVAVLPAGDAELTRRRRGRMLTFGEERGADVRVEDVELDERGRPSFRLAAGGESIDVALEIPGRHQPLNAAAAIAVALALGRSLDESVGRLATASVSRWRMELIRVAVPGGEVTIVNDAYNANPDSMSSALLTAAEMPGRRIAVLGKMHELGATETRAHREIGKLAADLGFRVIVVGDDPGIADGAGRAAVHVDGAAAALETLLASIEPGDVVLVKASRAAGLEEIAIGLQEVAA